MAEECPEPQSSSSGTRNLPSDLSYSRSPTSSLLVSIESLVNRQSIEKQCLEFKRSWNTGPVKLQVVRTVSAFANDIYNDNGGYIVIGVAEDESDDADGQIELPPVGIPAKDMDRIQMEIMGACQSLIKPSYTPILSPQILDDKHVLVIWAAASDSGPHRARESEKGEYHYFIRKASSTRKASEEEKTNLLQNCRRIPFDDQMAKLGTGQKIHHDAISVRLLMEFLDEVHSKLERVKDRSILTKMSLVVWRGNEEKEGDRKPIFTPKNVALLMFNHVPHVYFPGAKIEVSHFTRENEVIMESEKVFTGPLPKQIKECMDYVYAATNKEKSVSLITFPFQALREAIVNAVYHRGYEPEYDNSIKVYIRPHCLEIISYPGPHPSLKQEEFTKGSGIRPVRARNRRIGEFLRELNLAEARGTGVQTIFRTMEKNDNPEPEFDFDASYFRVKLPAHPKFQAAMLMKDVEELEACGNVSEAREVLRRAFDEDPTIINQHLMQKLIFLFDGNSDHPHVKKYEAYTEPNTKKRCALLTELEQWLSDEQNARKSISTGVSLIEQLVKVDADEEDLSSVVDFVFKLYNERTEMRKPILKSNQAAHQLVESFGRALLSESGSLAFHFACIKYQIYTIIKGNKDRRSVSKKNRGILKYLIEARDLLQNAICMSSGREDPKLYANKQRQLGYVYRHLSRVGRARKSDPENCFEKAQRANPNIRIQPFY